MSKLAKAVRPSPTGTAAPVSTDDAPFITSSVNGMVVPLLPHQGGILHRFKKTGNTVVVDKTYGATEPDDRQGRRMVMESPLNPSTEEELAADAESKAEMESILGEQPLL